MFQSEKLPELLELTAIMRDRSKRLDKATRQIFKMAREKAESERDYRIALGQEIMKLRSEGMPATLVQDVARANIADIRFKRDLADTMYWSAVSSMDAIKTELSVLQTISKYQSEVGG